MCNQLEPPASPSYSDASSEMCWICLEDESPNRPLASPCACPRKVHIECMARWQLQQAGRKEESNCRFCNGALPDWKSSLTPSKPAAQVYPVMMVTLGNSVHRIRVKPGPEGLVEFQAKVRELFNIPPGVEFECTFKCKAPSSGDLIQLDGMASYEAATHCASLLASQRVAAAKQRGPVPPMPAAASMGQYTLPGAMHQAPAPTAQLVPMAVAPAPGLSPVPPSFGWVPV